MVRIVIGGLIPIRKIRVQVQEFKNKPDESSNKISSSKSLTLYDTEEIVDINELHKRLIKTVDDYAKELNAKEAK